MATTFLAAAIEDVWDVFISYRVNSDKELVKELYWMLRDKDVRVQGKQENPNNVR